MFKKMKGLNQNQCNVLLDSDTYKRLATCATDEDLHLLHIKTTQITCPKRTYMLDCNDPQFFAMSIKGDVHKKFGQTATNKGTVPEGMTTKFFVRPPLYPDET